MKNKEWATLEATDIKIQRYDTRELALIAERESIISEKPKYNICHNRGVSKKVHFDNLLSIDRKYIGENYEGIDSSKFSKKNFRNWGFNIPNRYFDIVKRRIPFVGLFSSVVMTGGKIISFKDAILDNYHFFYTKHRRVIDFYIQNHFVTIEDIIRNNVRKRYLDREHLVSVYHICCHSDYVIDVDFLLEIRGELLKDDYASLDIRKNIDDYLKHGCN